MSSAPDAPSELISWRVDSKPFEKNGRTACRWVPYLDAAAVARLLDEWVGPENWQDHYEPVTLDGKEALWCSLSVRIGETWTTKTDVGTASNMEAQKGMVSDAFKRAACLKWGVGRNVYDLPTLWAVCEVDQRGNARESRNTQTEIQRQIKQRTAAVDHGGSDTGGAGGIESVPSQGDTRQQPPATIGAVRQQLENAGLNAEPA